MDLRQFQALRAIARTGSFTVAARQLNVTQSALSHQIKNLELELGETLVMRSKPRVRLAPAGERVLACADRVLGEISRLKRQFAQLENDEPEGALRVAVSALALDYLFAHICEAFIVAYPRIELIVTATETPAEGVRQVIARRSDVAFTSFPLETSSNALDLVTLGRSEHLMVAAPKHPLARLEEVGPEQLRRSSFIRYGLGAGARGASDQFFKRAGGYPPILMESNDTGFVKRIVIMGLGIALMPYATVRQELAKGELKALPVQRTPLSQDFGLAYRRGTRMRALDLFKKLCLERRDTIPSRRPERPGWPTGGGRSSR